MLPPKLCLTPARYFTVNLLRFTALEENIDRQNIVIDALWRKPLLL